MNTTCVPGHELTKEPFRWDQRIFGLVMKLPGSVPIDINSNMFIPSAENHPLDAMCEVTGGEIIYTQCSSFFRVTTSISLEMQIVLAQIRTDKASDLIWIQTV